MSIIKKIKSIPTYFKKNMALVMYHVLFFIVALTNFPFNSSFLGWDSVHPEFDFALNFSRNIFGSWQGNYGLGTLGGHGFSALLPHTLILWMLSFVLDTAALRPAFTFLCLYAGGIGMYVLMKYILTSLTQGHHQKQLTKYIPWISLVAALYYSYNLGTVMMFYVQLEVFIANFAALPWLFYFAIKILKEKSRRSVTLFIIANFLSAPQGFIPSVFLAYFLGLVVMLFTYCIFDRNAIKKSIAIIFLTLVVNAFWLIPVAYYSSTSGSTRAESYDSSQLTREIIAKNKEYGSLPHSAILANTTFENKSAVDDTSYFFGGLTEHFMNNLIQAVGLLFFGLSVVGIVWVLIKRRNPLLLALAAVYITFFTVYNTGQYPLSIITDLLVKYAPIYGDAFRAPITKFVMALAFVYSIFISISVFLVIDFLISKNMHKRAIAVTSSLLVALIIYTAPSYTGSFLADQFKLKIPPAYQELMTYFQQQEPARIADLPQDSFIGWFHYNWGYDGSGFLWYGIPQPITARTFDVWARTNENYFWEISYALRRQDMAQMESVFKKYDIRWILYDQNVINMRNPKGYLHLEKSLEYLQSSPLYKQVKIFESDGLLPIYVFERIDEDTQSFVSIDTNMQNIGPSYEINENDTASQTNTGRYITDENSSIDTWIPFRTMTTKRSTAVLDFPKITKSSVSISFIQSIPALAGDYELVLPEQNLQNQEQAIRLTFVKGEGNSTDLEITYLVPSLIIDGSPILSPAKQTIAKNLPTKTQSDSVVMLNGQNIPIDEDGSYTAVLYPDLRNELMILDVNDTVLFQTSLSSYEPETTRNVVSLEDKNVLELQVPIVTSDQLYYRDTAHHLFDNLPAPCPSSQSKEPLFELSNPVNKPSIRMISENSNECINHSFYDLPNEAGYLITLNTRNVSGEKPKFYITNKRAIDYLNVFVDESTSEWNSFAYILPPSIPGELGYDIWYENISYTKEKSINEFGGIEVYRIPYDLITGIYFQSTAYRTQSAQISNFSVKHPNDTYYEVSYSSIPDNTTLTLSQSFHPGWNAYSITCSANRVACNFEKLFPFFFGRELKDHVLVNNWANGWRLSDQEIKGSKDQELSTQIVIIFWPQYLQYLGYGILALAMVVVFVKSIHSFMKKRG